MNLPQADAQSVQTTPSLNDLSFGERFDWYYDRLHACLIEDSLNFKTSGDLSALSGRRIQEAVLYRLKIMPQNQLYGRRDGYCFVCQKPHENFLCREPICFNCLERIYQAGIGQDILTETFSLTSGKPVVTERVDEHSEHPEQEADAKISGIVEEIARRATAPPPQAVTNLPLEVRYQQALQELRYYKMLCEEYNLPPYRPVQSTGGPTGESLLMPDELHQSGASRPFESPQVDSLQADGTEAVSDLETLPLEPPVEAMASIQTSPALDSPVMEDAVESLLCILDMKDEDIESSEADANSLEELLPTVSSAPLRHFGFQRFHAHRRG